MPIIAMAQSHPLPRSAWPKLHRKPNQRSRRSCRLLMLPRISKGLGSAPATTVAIPPAADATAAPAVTPGYSRELPARTRRQMYWPDAWQPLCGGHLNALLGG